MSDGIWIALIGLLGIIATTLGSVMVARINTQLKRIGADAAEARHQTKNSHAENLRDSLDREFQRVHASIGGLHDDVRGVRVEITSLRSDDGRQRDDMARMQQGIPAQIDAAIRACRTRDVTG